MSCFFFKSSDGLPQEIVQRFSGNKKKGKKGTEAEDESSGAPDQGTLEPVRIILTFKKYVYDPQKKMRQT